MLATRTLMPTKVVKMVPMGFHTTDVSMFLKVEDFTVYDNVFWSFQVRGLYTVIEICSAESKNHRVSVEMVCGAVPHREVHIVIGSLPSSPSYNSFYLVHSESSKITILSFVLVKGFICLLSVVLSIRKEIQEYRTVFGISQC